MLIHQKLLNHPRLYAFYKEIRTLRLAETFKQAVYAVLPKSLTPALPKDIVIDSSSICNLACPLCPTGNRTLNLKKAFLSLEDFKRFISQFPTLSSVSLYNWGEPLLNPQLIDIVRYAKEKHIHTDIDTNLSIPLSDEKIDSIVLSGLRAIRISLDGASQKTYEVYRKYGRFDLVFNNMRRLNEAKKRLGATTPAVYWKFLVHKHNEHEKEKAKTMAKRIGVDLVFDFFQLSDDISDVVVQPETTFEQKRNYWLPQKSSDVSPYYRNGYKKPFLRRPCPWLFSSLVVHTDGKVLPCCYVSSEDSAMGDLNKQNIEDIWRSPKYQYARSLFIKGSKIPRVPVACEGCPIYLHANK